jgi:copper homeostasis protein
MKMERIIEVCAGSCGDCLAAEKGGAQRVELNSALSVGGLTPSLASLQKVKSETALSVICMVRPRAGGFCYDEMETEIMLEDARILLEHGADGIAFGFLKKDGTVDAVKTKKMTEQIHSCGKEAVFHRAFDVTPNPREAIETLIDCGIDRVLTGGQCSKAMDGISLIRDLQKAYGQQIQILPGSGLNADNARQMLEETGVFQIHSSCKGYRFDPTTSAGDVTYSYLDGIYKDAYDAVEEELVRKLVLAVKGAS